MTSGLIISEIVKEIRNIPIIFPELRSVYGFGSFFREVAPNDCDLLMVIAIEGSDLGSIHAGLSSEFKCLGDRLGVQFDLTILTEEENEGQPLQEHSALIPLLLGE